MRLVCQCHAKTHISPVAEWHQGSWDWSIISVDESWNLATCVQECCWQYWWSWWREFVDAWHSCPGLWFECKLGQSRKGDFQCILLSLTIDDVLEFGKYFDPVYSARSGEQSGMAQSISWLALLLENFAIMRSAAAAVHLPQLEVVYSLQRITYSVWRMILWSISMKNSWVGVLILLSLL